MRTLPACTLCVLTSCGGAARPGPFAASSPDDGRCLVLAAQSQGHGNAFLYYKISELQYTIRPGDALEYDLYIDPTSPEPVGGVDIQFAGGGNLRDSGAKDDAGRNVHPHTKLPEAVGRWLHRRIPLDLSTGQITERWDVVAEGDKAGTYLQYVDDVVVTRGGRIVAEVYRATLSVRAIDWHSGYAAARTLCTSVRRAETFPAGFVAAEPEGLDPHWHPLDLGPSRSAVFSMDNTARSYAPDGFPAGRVYVAGVPFWFVEPHGRSHVVAGGQRVGFGEAGGGRYYEVHLACANNTPGAIPAVFTVSGPNDEVVGFSLDVPGWTAPPQRPHDLTLPLTGGKPGETAVLGVLSAEIAAPFPIAAMTLPKDPRVRVFALTLRRRDDAPDDAEFRRAILARHVPGEAMERYLRNLRFGPSFADLTDETEHERALFELAVAGQRRELDDRLARRLAVFRERGAARKADRVYFVGESHIDLEWLWPWRETIDVCRDTFGQALQFMEEFPDFRFTQGIAQAYQWMKDIHPDLYRRIQSRVSGGQWEVVGGMWTEPDFNMPEGEALARQLLFGGRFFHDEFGRDVTIGWAPDSFGYCFQLPQLLRAAGIDCFFTTKMLWNEATKFPHHIFRWQSPDGSEVLGVTPPQGIGSRVSPQRIKAHLDAMEEKHGVRSVVIPFGVGDHGGGPSREDIETIRALQQTDLAPTVKMSTFVEYLYDVRKDAAIRLPVLRDEMYLQYHQGTFTSQGRIKWFNRKGEVLLLSGERFAALADAEGHAFPADDFRELWRRVLFHQCHDGLPGTSIPQVKHDIADDFAWVLPTGQRRLEAAISKLTEDIDTTGPGRPLVLFNPLAWDRAARVEIPWEDVDVRSADGSMLPTQRAADEKLLFVASVPSFGYTVVHLVPRTGDAKAAAGGTVSVEDATVRNESFLARLNRSNGHLAEVSLLPDGPSVLDGEGNLLEIHDDHPAQWDAWNLGLSNRRILDGLDDLMWVERGPVRAVARLERSFGKSRLTQDVVVQTGCPWIEFRSRVDWHEDHQFLRAAFPLRYRRGHATYHVPYGTIERPADPKTDAERAMYEVPALFWAEQGDGRVGAALMNDCKYGYSASQEWLKLSLLKAATWPDPEQDQGTHEFTYAFYPHTGDWRAARTMQAAYELNYPVYVAEARPHAGRRSPAGSFLRVALRPDGGDFEDGAASGLLLGAFKPAEEGEGWIVRIAEVYGRAGVARLTFDRPILAASSVDLLERPKGSVTRSGSEVEFPIGAHRIETIHVRPAPAP